LQDFSGYQRPDADTSAYPGSDIHTVFAQTLLIELPQNASRIIAGNSFTVSAVRAIKPGQQLRTKSRGRQYQP